MPSWPLLLALLIALWLSVAGSDLLQDPDTYWHVAAGEWMLEQGSVPNVDPFSHSVAGQPWAAHEWFAEVILALAHGQGGWPAMVLLAVLCIAFSYGWLLRYLLAHLPPLYALVAVVLAIMLSAGHLMVRPHVLALPLLVLWCCELFRARDEARPPGWWLLPVMVVWANLHGGFTMGLVIAAFMAMEAILQAQPARRGSVLRGWLWFGLAAGAASLLTPHGIHGPLFTLHLFGDPGAMDFIIEWAPPDLTAPHRIWLWLPVCVLVLFLIRGHLHPVRWLMLGGCLWLLFRYDRSAELVAVLSALLLAAPLGGRLRDRSAESGLDAIFARLARPASHGAAAGWVLGTVLLAGVILQLRVPQPAASITPAQALQAAQHAGITGPVFNFYNFGGYLMYRDIAPFIDGRADMYGGAFCKQYLQVSQRKMGDADIRAVLNRYGISWTLLPPDSRLVGWLAAQPDWRMVYADEIAVVHRRAAAP